MSDVEPSVPLIAYLFADRLLPPRRNSHGTHVPCSTQCVHTQSLAVLLFSAAFWSLREQALIELNIVEHPSTRWPVHHHHDVNLKRLDRASRPGLEGAVMESLEDETTLCDVVYRWSDKHSNNPWHDVIEEETAEALAAGYLKPASENTGVLARLIGHGNELDSDCSKIAGLEGKFSSFHESWGDFRENESPVYEHVTTECKKALLTCTECWYP